jgi:hypothetical protein
MGRTLTANMEAERIKDGVTGAWLVEATFDQTGLSTTSKYFADSQRTFDSKAWVGEIVAGGIDIGFLRIKPQGGLAPVATWNLKLRDENAHSLITETHVVFNDEVILYFLFITGSEVSADKIEIRRGQIERHPSKHNVWRLQMKDQSRKDFKMIPTAIVDPIVYPYAFNLGAVIPEVFGDLNVEPKNSIYPALAPCRFLNRYLSNCTSSLYKKTGGTTYQWYAGASRFAEIVTDSETANVLTVDDASRIMLMRPSRVKGTNDVALWQTIADGNESAGHTLLTGENLDVYFSGTPKLGAMTAIKLIIKASGAANFDYTLKDDTTTITGPTTVSGDVSYTLTLGNYSDNWDVSLLNIEFDYGTAGMLIEEAYIQVEFEDFLAWFEEEPQIYQSVSGWKDNTANLFDGSIIDVLDAAPRNPVHVLQALLRGKNLHTLETAKIGTMSDAATSRSTWKADFALNGQVSDKMLDKFAFEFGLSIWNQDGAHQCVALDKERSSIHFFYGGYHEAIDGDASRPDGWQYSFELLPPDASKIFNEINIRYARHPATGVPQKNKVASGQFRLSGTCATSASTEKLTDGSATFVTDAVLVGERIYVGGDVDYQVSAIDSETVLSISPVIAAGVSDNAAGVSYWLGANIRGECLLSQQSYKMTNALGGNRQSSFLTDGGFVSDFIADDTTADALIEHAVEWFAEPRERARFALMHDAIKVQCGDVFYFDHPKLKTQHRSLAVTAMNGAINNSTTSLTVTTGEVGLIRAGDYLYVQDTVTSEPEVMLVDSIDTGTDIATVQRGQCNTTATSHVDLLSIQRLTWKWIITGVREMTPTDTRILIEAERMPNAYFPVGIAVLDVSPDYDAASEAQRASSGWATLQNGRVEDNDADSNISYARTG